MERNSALYVVNGDFLIHCKRKKKKKTEKNKFKTKEESDLNRVRVGVGLYPTTFGFFFLLNVC